jgi:hypothetical protein
MPTLADVTELWPVTGAQCGETAVLWARVMNTGTEWLPPGAEVRFIVEGPEWSVPTVVGSASAADLMVGVLRWYRYDWAIPEDMTQGEYLYRAQVWSDGRPVSVLDLMESFSICGEAAPGAVTLAEPGGAITGRNPTYMWQEDPCATWYYLWVSDASGPVIKQWYPTGAVCSDGTCLVTPDVTLAEGGHRWWVQAWNPEGYGPWSSRMDFSVQLLY